MVRFLYFATTLLLSAIVCSCSTETQSDLEVEFTILNSQRWGDDDVCAEEDCPEPLTVEDMKRYCWAEVDPLSWSVDLGPHGEDPSGNGFFEIIDLLRGQPDDVVLGEVRRDTAESMRQAVVNGHRLVLGTECPANAASRTPIQQVIAIDGQGRIAGIGPGAARRTTLPIAEGAAASSAATSEAYLVSILRE